MDQQQPQEKKKLHQEVRERTLGYVTAALGLVAGLAWNDAIKALIEKVFPKDSGSLGAQFIYAIIVTIAVVILTTYLVRLINRENK